MKKEDLRSGMVVKLRNGCWYLVLEHDGILKLLLENGGADIDCYDENLLNINGFKEFDIVSIGRTNCKNLKTMLECEIYTIFKRVESKEMTIEEVEKELGYKIKIILD